MLRPPDDTHTTLAEPTGQLVGLVEDGADVEFEVRHEVVK